MGTVYAKEILGGAAEYEVFTSSDPDMYWDMINYYIPDYDHDVTITIGVDMLESEIVKRIEDDLMELMTGSLDKGASSLYDFTKALSKCKDYMSDDYKERFKYQLDSLKDKIDMLNSVMEE